MMMVLIAHEECCWMMVSDVWVLNIPPVIARNNAGPLELPDIHDPPNWAKGRRWGIQWLNKSKYGTIANELLGSEALYSKSW